jgi:hypothetical protein
MIAAMIVGIAAKIAETDRGARAKATIRRLGCVELR